jgi:hypothetical protein
MTTSAIAKLSAAFDATFTSRALLADADLPTVVLSWPAVPIEIIPEAGLRPVIARGSVTPTPAADSHLEPDIFPSRLRSLMEAAPTGHLSRAARIVIPASRHYVHAGAHPAVRFASVSGIGCGRV